MGKSKNIGRKARLRAKMDTIHQLDMSKLDQYEYGSIDWIEEFLSQKPMLKDIDERVPEIHLKKIDIQNLLSERTGFQVSDIRELLDEYYILMYEQLIAGGAFYFPRVGYFFLKSLGPRKKKLTDSQTQFLPKGTITYKQPRKLPHFHPVNEFKAFCKKIPVSKFDLEQAYRGTKRTDEEIEIARKKDMERLLGNTTFQLKPSKQRRVKI